jgi:hypothetical protein
MSTPISGHALSSSNHLWTVFASPCSIRMSMTKNSMWTDVTDTSSFLAKTNSPSWRAQNVWKRDSNPGHQGQCTAYRYHQSCRLSLAALLLGLLLKNENRCDLFFRNAIWLSLDYSVIICQKIGLFLTTAARNSNPEQSGSSACNCEYNDRTQRDTSEVAGRRDTSREILVPRHWVTEEDGLQMMF